MATILDVAKKAGVSLGTASNVINGKASVSMENRMKVEAAIAQLGYHRNQAAIQLRTNRSNTIGLVIPDIVNPFYPEVARGVDDTARKFQYNIFLCNKDRSDANEVHSVEALLSKNVDGILLLKPKAQPDWLDHVSKQSALLLVDANPQVYHCNIINVDDDAGIASAVEEAARLGHRHIGFIAGRPDSFSSERRLRGFVATIARLGIEEKTGYIRHGDYTFQSGYAETKALLDLEVPPTLIITANDMMALGSMQAARELGINIPGELSIVGYDDILNAQWSNPPLTTIWHPKYDLGQKAAETLMLLIEQRRKGKENKPVALEMQTKLVTRGTLAPPSK